MIYRLLVAGGISLVSMTAFAQVSGGGMPAPTLPNNSIDVRLAGTHYEEEFEGETLEIDGNGLDLRGSFAVNDSVVIRIQYLQSDSDEIEVAGSTFDLDTELSILRLGPVIQGDIGTSGSVKAYGGIEIVRVGMELEGDDNDGDGYTLLAGLKDAGRSNFLWSVELGYVDIEDSTGALFEFNLGYRITPNVAIVGGGQGYATDDDGYETSVSSGTIGARLLF